jgi:hypothetical protein
MIITINDELERERGGGGGVRRGLFIGFIT